MEEVKVLKYKAIHLMCTYLNTHLKTFNINLTKRFIDNSIQIHSTKESIY